MNIEIVIVLISSVLSVIITALVTSILSRRKSQAEIDKLTAEAGKARAETEKIKAETASLLGEIKSSTSTIICYRQTIKLINEATGHALHSHNANYAHEGTSGQFQVTAFSGANNDDYWIVKSAHNHPEFYKEKQPVRNGDIIRLEHKNSKRNLHSHYKVAPITKGQQEITTWGENGIHDTNDNWQIEFEDNKDHLWVEGKKIRLIHQGTRAVLHSNSVYSETLFYQDEVTGVSISERGPNDYWHAVMVE